MIGSRVLIDSVVLHRLLPSIERNAELATMEEGRPTAHAEARKDQAVFSRCPLTKWRCATIWLAICARRRIHGSPGTRFVGPLRLPGGQAARAHPSVGVASSRVGFGTHIPPPRSNFCSRRTNARWTLCPFCIGSATQSVPSDMQECLRTLS